MQQKEKNEAIQNTSVHQDVEYMRNLGENVSEFQKGDKQKSVSQIFNNKLITRAPKKLLDYMKGYLLVVKGNLIIYANIETYRIDTLEESNNEVVEIDLKENALDYINLNSKFRIIALQDLGILNEEANLSYIVLEEIKSRQIRFL